MIYAFQSDGYNVDGAWIFVGTEAEFVYERNYEIELEISLYKRHQQWFEQFKLPFGRPDVSRRIQHVIGDYMFKPKVIGMVDGEEIDAAAIRRRLDPEWPRGVDYERYKIYITYDNMNENESIDELVRLDKRWWDGERRSLFASHPDHRWSPYRGHPYKGPSENPLDRGELPPEVDFKSDGNWFDPRSSTMISFIQEECRPWDGLRAEQLGIKGLGRRNQRMLPRRPSGSVAASVGLGSRLARRPTKAD